MKNQQASYASTLILLALLVAGLPCLADESDVVGTWLTGDGDGWVEININEGTLSGTVAGSPVDDPNRSTVDDKNPDPTLRERELLGLELFSGFRFDGKKRWTDGTVYDPNNGKTYRCIITVIDENRLKVRGYIGIALLGRTETWTRKARL